jgi:hypothetical protein
VKSYYSAKFLWYLPPNARGGAGRVQTVKRGNGLKLHVNVLAVKIEVHFEPKRKTRGMLLRYVALGG